MALLTPEATTELKKEIVRSVSVFLDSYNKPEPRLTGLITQSELKKELNIDYNTLKRWEDNGLKRYQAPMEDTRKVFYRVKDILIFLGVK